MPMLVVLDRRFYLHFFLELGSFQTVFVSDRYQYSIAYRQTRCKESFDGSIYL